MTVAYQSALLQARLFLREEGNRLTPTDWLLIAEQARQHFSRDKPSEQIGDITSTGASSYTITGVGGLTGWVLQVSTIKTIENPTGQQVPVYWDTGKFTVYRPSSTTDQLRFLGSIPANGTTIRVTFSAPHTFSEASSTILDTDLMLIGLLIASYAAQALMADFLKPNRSNLPNDSSDFSQKARDMGELSDRLLKSYSKMVASSSEGVKQHYTFVKDYDMLKSDGSEFLIHDEEHR